SLVYGGFAKPCRSEWVRPYTTASNCGKPERTTIPPYLQRPQSTNRCPCGAIPMKQERSASLKVILFDGRCLAISGVGTMTNWKSYLPKKPSSFRSSTPTRDHLHPRFSSPVSGMASFECPMVDCL